METILFCDTLEQLPAVAQEVINLAKLHSIWLFEGEMGAGKTTLIKAICHKMGVLNTVQSPTYSIVNEYITATNETIYHFDCYRLKNEHEALDFGIEEYLDSGNYCFIEWSSKIQSLIPSEHLVIEIDVNEEGKRTIYIGSAPKV